jgi:hypothetical protein
MRGDVYDKPLRVYALPYYTQLDTADNLSEDV